MSYLGRGLEQVDNISKLDNITFNGGTTYALTKDSAAFTPISSNAILISIDGVVQQGNFSVSGTNIVFNFSPTSSNTCNWILHMGTGVAFTPADSSITKDKANFISTSSSAGLQIKGDGTTDGTLQLNCSQNSHGVKIKSPSHSSSQSYTLTLPGTAPAANKILQTDSSGNLSFVDKPSGKLVFIANQEGTNSVGDVSFNDCFSAAYKTYFITFQLQNDRDGNNINFRFQADDDSTFNNNYKYALHTINHSGTENNFVAGSGGEVVLTGGTEGGNSGYFGVCNGFMYVHRPYTYDSDLNPCFFNIFSQEVDTGGNFKSIHGGGFLNQTSYNVAGIRFRPGANYMTNRNVTVYGLEQS
jgi:hypothetical protein